MKMKTNLKGKIMKKIALVLCLLVGVIAISCVPLSYYLTPADLDPQSIDYVTNAGVADANKYAGYPNLHKAEMLKEDVESAYKITQFELEKAAEKNNLDYSICAETTAANYTAAIQREEDLFGKEGGIATLLGIAGLSGATGLLGLMRKRPGDITPEEASKAVAEATGESQAEIEAKINQFNQVVKGVGEFKNVLEEHKDSNRAVAVADILTDMKNIFNANQDTETQKAVATARKS